MLCSAGVYDPTYQNILKTYRIFASSIFKGGAVGGAAATAPDENAGQLHRSEENCSHFVVSIARMITIFVRVCILIHVYSV